MNDALRAEGPVGVGIRNVDFFHGPYQVLRQISLDLLPGRHYIVAGPNGAGKSTLLDLLANLRRPRSGRICVGERDIASFAPGGLARIIALAPQEFRLDFSFSVREIVAMGRRPYLDRWGRLGKEDEEMVENALLDMRLDRIADKSVMTLSGGEKRRCIVARALAQDTPVILLDEPCSGLDIAQALSTMALARKKAEEGALVVTVSHDLNLAARYGHELILLRDGALAASGPVENVFTGSVLSETYQADARVNRDAYTGALTASFDLKPAPIDPASEFKA